LNLTSSSAITITIAQSPCSCSPHFRPTEVDALLGDPSKARAKLGWKHKTSFDALVKEMVEADMATIFKERERRDRHA
jgi:GDPmannose 4,6-dehydratase